MVSEAASRTCSSFAQAGAPFLAIFARSGDFDVGLLKRCSVLLIQRMIHRISQFLQISREAIRAKIKSSTSRKNREKWGTQIRSGHQKWAARPPRFVSVRRKWVTRQLLRSVKAMSRRCSAFVTQTRLFKFPQLVVLGLASQFNPRMEKYIAR